MVTHQGVLRSEPSVATLNVTQSARPLEVPEKNPSEYRSPGRPRTPRTPISRMRNPQGPGGAPRSRYQTPSRPDVQCVACSPNGHHTADVCEIPPRVHLCMEIIAAQPTQATESLQQYRKTNHPMTKRQNKERLVNVLLSKISYQQTEEDGWWEDVKDLLIPLLRTIMMSTMRTVRNITRRSIGHKYTRILRRTTCDEVLWTRISSN